ncbi:Hypothetical predicted protein [Mytilus galloprovincialis]|uniref:Chromo domain-containing protein n=1 Tax=Mytilus galloprovincialis TaxID=29158 RepID=A0A8B6H325_MYTGA|nr:Hypothetical predicted protein [Mytilus galloprovincialis]
MSPSASSEFSPYHLLFGKEMNLPVDTTLLPKTDLNKNLKFHIENILDCLKIAKRCATDNLQYSQERQKSHYDKNTALPQFEIQDLVLMHNPKVPVGLSSKLHRKNNGPFYIVAKGPNHTFKLRRCEDNKLLKSMINSNRLKKYIPPDHRPDQNAPPPDEPRPDPRRTEQPNFQQQDPNPDPAQNSQTDIQDSDEPVEDNSKQFYDIEKLLQRRKYKGEPQFLVKWVGFKEKTWEPEQNLPIQLVRQFLATKTQGGALSYATVFSWILLVGIYAVNADGEVQMHRINYGVTFAKEANIVFGSENWLHTFEIPLPHKISSVQFPRCDIVHQNCHILNQIISQLSAVRTGVTANINNTIDVIHRLVKKADFNLDTRSQSRSKRGLFDFIGSISRSLFGTATVKDVQKLARHINILAERNNKFAKAMSHHDEELSSFMTNTDSRFSNVMRGIQKNYDSIENVTFETAKFVAHFEDVSLKLSNLFIDQMNDSSVITKYLEELNIGIHEMVKGKLSPFLISPKILNDAIKHIKLILSYKFKGFYILNSDPAYYYSECNMLFARKHSTLYVTVKFPISTFAFPLYLYKITSYSSSCKCYKYPCNSDIRFTRISCRYT